MEKVLAIIVIVLIWYIFKWIRENIYESVMKNRIKYEAIWNDYFIDVKKLYATKYKMIPNIYFIGEIDTGKAYGYLTAFNSNLIIKTWQHNFFDKEADTGFFNATVIELKGNRMIEIGHNYVYVFHNWKDFCWANETIAVLKQFTLEKEDLETKNEVVKVVGFAKQATMN